MSGAMDPASDPERLSDLLERARALPHEGRRQLLAGVDDAALRRELASLLDASDQAESFFDDLAGALDAAAAGMVGSDMEFGPTLTPAGAAGLPAAAAELQAGQSVAQYRIVDRLGAGGMGVVYRAFDSRLERMVALKFPSVGPSRAAWSTERFLVEARAAASLDHPNVCTIHEVGVTSDGASYIAMAFYAGETLEQVLRRGPLEPDTAVDYALQIARGLGAAHDVGITHRDVKPGNVLITTDGVVKLLDFGIAQRASEPATPSAVTPGTLDYMSPEQMSGAPVDHRTDLWSLGVVLYEMYTGERPLRRGGERATVRAILRAGPTLPARRAGPASARLGAVIARLLEADPEARYASAAELLQDLAAAATALAGAAGGERALLRRPGSRAVVAALGAVAVVAALLGVVQPPDRSRILIAAGVGDTTAGTFVSERVRTGLSASRRLDVAGPPDVEGALRLMGLGADTRLTPDIAHDIALREGIEAYVHVTVDRVDAAFLLGALLVETATRNYLDFYSVTALDSTELGGAADSLASAIGNRFGDRLEGVPAGTPRFAVTTASNSALASYMDAVQANRIGEFERGIALLDETISLDARFGDAYLTKSFALEQVGRRGGLGQAQVLTAWALRDSLARHERFTVEADYAWQIEGDLDKAARRLRAFHEEVARLHPGRVLNRRSYGLALVLRGRLAEAESVLQEGRALAPCPVTKSILVGVLHALNRDGEAHGILREAALEWPTNPLLATDSAHFAALSGNYRRAHDVARAAQFGGSKPFALRAMAVFDAADGRIAEATDHLEALRGDLVARGLLAPAFEVTAGMGRLKFVANDTAAGVRLVEDYLERTGLTALPPEERPYLSLALFFADARRPARARALLAEYEDRVAPVFRGADGWMLLRVRASLYMAVDSPRLALDALRAARGADRIWSEWFSPLLFEMDARPELARVYDRLGARDSAIAVYDRYLGARVLHRAELDAFELAPARRRLAILRGRE